MTLPTTLLILAALGLGLWLLAALQIAILGLLGLGLGLLAALQTPMLLEDE